ncbi:MAG: hypothetical protein A2583_11965 [Bdellovibrionales bacterium RIFOXYD1_FULL_53_11]|nr:MAG: hypothetical protein A2583_11965 [Bdellovibrionales bacterium RIFOXYD1_FULL_53_11]
MGAVNLMVLNPLFDFQECLPECLFAGQTIGVCKTHQGFGFGPPDAPFVVRCARAVAFIGNSAAAAGQHGL